MKRTALTLLAAFCTLATAFTQAAAPFTIAIVPSKSQAPPQGRFISMADDKPDVFHVVLTNISKEAQPVFETWNSWGYQTIRFELTLPDGKQVTISVAPQNFTRNFPSTYLILPGEHQVYPIRLDKEWEISPKVSFGSETAIVLKAIYEVVESPESTAQHVWTGRIESKPCQTTLRHW